MDIRFMSDIRAIVESVEPVEGINQVLMFLVGDVVADEVAVLALAIDL